MKLVPSKFSQIRTGLVSNGESTKPQQSLLRHLWFVYDLLSLTILWQNCLYGTLVTTQVRLLWVKSSNLLKVMTFPPSDIVLCVNPQMVPVLKEQSQLWYMSVIGLKPSSGYCKKLPQSGSPFPQQAKWNQSGSWTIASGCFPGKYWSFQQGPGHSLARETHTYNSLYIY